MAENKAEIIGFDGKSFIIGGKRVFIYGAEMHYFRIPPSQWRDRLLKAKRAFVNGLGVYMPWNWHEQEEGQFCFEGDRDVGKWLQLAEELGLYIIARPGPYICSEWDFGGFPNWLIAKDCEMRSLDPHFMDYCAKWLNRADAIIEPHLITKGGNVFIYQVENEFRVGDLPYHLKLKQIAEEDGINVPFVTNINPRIRGSQIIEMPDPYLRSWDISGPMNLITEVRKAQPDKPPFGMEVGCLQYCEFGEPLPFAGGVAPPERDEVYLKSLIAAGISGFNYYMYHGGTNPGYWTGKDIATTYDFDAPIREWGELNERYYISRRLGAFLECFGEKLLETVPAEGVCKVSDRDVKVYVRKDDNSAYLFPVHLFAKDVDVKLTLKQPDGEELEIPRHGSYRLAEYSMSILPVNLGLSEDLTLLYSTSQIFYFMGGDEEVLILYERPGFQGETVLELGDRDVEISGKAGYEWTEDGKLCLNYVHAEEPETILIKGARSIRLVVVPTNLAARTWIVRYKGKPLPIISNITFLRGWEDNEKKLVLHTEIREGRGVKVRVPGLPAPQAVKVNGERVAFSYDDRNEVIELDLDEPEMPEVYYDLSGTWKMKEEDFDHEDEGWREWAPWAPLENYGFLKNGYCWYRTSFEISGADTPLQLILTGFQDEVSLYLNGEYVGSGVHRFKKDVRPFVKSGRNALAIRLESLGHSCMGYKTYNGITHPVYLSAEERSIPLTEWKRKAVSNNIFREKELLKTPQPETVPDFDDSDWEAVRVDEKYDSRLSKNEEEVRFCWYRKVVEIPSGFAGMPLSLDFAETVEDAYIYVNGTFLKVERNTGLNLPFSVDISGQIRMGEKNNIAIALKAGRGCLLFGLHKSVKVTAHTRCLDQNWEIREKLSGQRAGWVQMDYEDADWDDVEIPVKGEIGQKGGIVWLRKKIVLKTPQGYVAPLRLTLKDTASKALIYFNGVLIGRYSQIGPQEDFYIWEDLIKQENVLVLVVDGREKKARLGDVSISAYYTAEKMEIAFSF